MLAQEVQKFFPELVNENTDGGLSVNYSGLIPVLITGLKEQQKQIEADHKQIEEMKNEIQELKTGRKK